MKKCVPISEEPKVVVLAKGFNLLFVGRHSSVRRAWCAEEEEGQTRDRLGGGKKGGVAVVGWGTRPAPVEDFPCISLTTGTRILVV